MLRYLRLLGLFVRVSIQDDAAYRVDFLAHILITLLSFGAEMLGLWTIFSNTRSLGGWNVFELLVVLGVFRAMHGIIGLTIAPNMRRLMEDIRDGRLDFVILKPVDAQFYASFRRIVVWRMTDIAMGMILVGVGCFKLHAHVDAGTVLTFMLMLAAGAVIIYSFWLVLATCAFWFTRLSNIEMVFWNVFEAGRYPVDIYPLPVRAFLTYLVPLAFIITFPAGALVGRVGGSTVVLALIVALVAGLGSAAFWRFGLRHYSGASA